VGIARLGGGGGGGGGGDRNTLSCFMLLKLDMSTSLMDYLACK